LKLVESAEREKTKRRGPSKEIGSENPGTTGGWKKNRVKREALHKSGGKVKVSKKLRKPRRESGDCQLKVKKKNGGDKSGTRQCGKK